MRRETAIRVAKDWANRVCNHPYKEAEYYLGKPTGYEVCVLCGKIFGKKSTTQFFKELFQKEYKIKFRL